MIITVTANPAIDTTYELATLSRGETHRIVEVHERAGGKGVNVARVLHQHGETVVATGLADGTFADHLDIPGLTSTFVNALPNVRRTVVIQESDHTTTGFWEPGVAPQLPDLATELLVKEVRRLLEDAHGLVVSGSLPPGVDPGLPARLGRLALDRSLPVVIDVDDVAIRVAAESGGAVLMPNLEELSRLIGRQVDEADAVTEARALATRTQAPVVVTLGAAGMVVAAEQCWRATPPAVVRGNATGAGDAAAAATIRGLARGDDWPAILQEAVASSAAAVASPLAGDIDLQLYRAWRSRVRVRLVDPSTPRSPQ